MGKLIVSTLIALGTLPAFAHDGGSDYGYEIQCSDPRVMQQFPTEAQAASYCSQWDNTYPIYDWAYGTYTCGCRTPDSPNGN